MDPMRTSQRSIPAPQRDTLHQFYTQELLMTQLDSTESPPPASTRNHRTVRFLETCSVRLIAPIGEYTDEEFNSCWYSDEETEQMTLDCIGAVRAYRLRQRCQEDRQRRDEQEVSCFNNKKRAAEPHKRDIEQREEDDQEDIVPCVRGLEAMLSPKDVAERKSARAECINAVLDEQDRQRHCRRGWWRGQNILGSNTSCNGDDADVDNDNAAATVCAASARASAPSVRGAILRALEDAAWVWREIQKEAAARQVRRRRRTLEEWRVVQLYSQQ